MIRALDLPGNEKRAMLFWFAAAAFMLGLLVIFIVLSEKQGKTISFWISGIWILLFVGWPLGFGVSGLRNYRNSLDLERNGLVGLATIVDTFEEDTVLGDQASTIICWIIFTPDTKVKIKQRVSRAVMDQVSRGDRIEVIYLPNKKYICRAKLE